MQCSRSHAFSAEMMPRQGDESFPSSKEPEAQASVTPKEPIQELMLQSLLLVLYALLNLCGAYGSNFAFQPQNLRVPSALAAMAISYLGQVKFLSHPRGSACAHSAGKQVLLYKPSQCTARAHELLSGG